MISNLFDVVVLSGVQGFFEFLPISSTAQVSIVGGLLDFELRSNLAFYAAAHFGSFVAIIWSTKHLIVTIFKKNHKDKGLTKQLPGGIPLVCLMVVATLPLSLVLLFKDFVEQSLASDVFVGSMLVINGVILLIIEFFAKTQNKHDVFGFKDAIVVGFAQLLAVFPGISRMGMSLAASISRGHDYKTAINFSLLVSIPAIMAAGVFAWGSAAMDSSLSLEVLIVTSAVSCVASILSIFLVVNCIKKFGFSLFALICFVTAGVAFF